MKYLILLINFCFLISMNIIAQDFSKHKWEYRLLIIFTQNEDSELSQRQFEELTSNYLGLLDRKILIYQILPNRYKVRLKSNSKWINSSISKNYEHPFQIKLIGLDGGVKISQNEFLTSEKLFALIDRMPMRRLELDNRK